MSKDDQNARHILCAILLLMAIVSESLAASPDYSFSQSEFLRVDAFDEQIKAIHTLPQANQIAVIGRWTGCLIDPISKKISKRFTLPGGFVTVIESKNEFLLLDTGRGFEQIAVDDLNGNPLWKYDGKFAHAFPICDVEDGIKFCIAHYGPGNSKNRFFILNSDYQTIYQDDTQTRNVTTTAKGAALCQLAKSGRYFPKQRMILRKPDGSILKEISLKHGYQSIVASGWPNAENAVAVTKGKIVLLDKMGREAKAVKVASAMGKIIMTAPATFCVSGGTEYLAVLLTHKSTVDFSTVVILDPAFKIVYQARIPESWGIASHRNFEGEESILVPGRGNAIMQLQRSRTAEATNCGGEIVS